MNRRLLIHVRRIQAVYRGRQQRKEYYAILSAQIILSWCWRRHWRKKYGKYAVKIQRCYRYHRLLRAAVLVQRIVRGWVARRAADKERRRGIVLEKNRCGLEQQALVAALKEAAAAFSREKIWENSAKLLSIMKVRCLVQYAYCFRP